MRTLLAATEDGPEHTAKYLAADPGPDASRGALRRGLEHPLVPASARAGVAEDQIVQ